MRLFEFSDAQSQMDLWKLVSDSVWKAISVQAQEQERIAQQAQQKQKKMPKTWPHSSLGRIPPAQFAQQQRIQTNAAANLNPQVLD